jgi:four helix bundle protein
MTPDELKHRTKTFAIEVIKLTRSFPRDVATDHMSRQLVKSGTSVGANYRSSCRAKSGADFVSEMTTVEEEADETLY